MSGWRLPASPGSIVAFDLPFDGERPFRAVAALIPGRIDKRGVAHDLVWATADVEHPTDQTRVFSPALIVASNPSIILETVATDSCDELRTPGVVVRAPERGTWTTYTFAPSFLADGEMIELFWTNSYGGISHLDAVDAVEVLYAPAY